MASLNVSFPVTGMTEALIPGLGCLAATLFGERGSPVFFAEVFFVAGFFIELTLVFYDGRLHQCGGAARAIVVLEAVKLSENVDWLQPSDPGYIAKSLQIGSMTNSAGKRLA